VRLPGYCSSCRRVRQVTVKPAELARGLAWARASHRGLIVEGVCAACEEEERHRSCQACQMARRVGRPGCTMHYPDQRKEPNDR
jgi:hypothetical protein